MQQQEQSKFSGNLSSIGLTEVFETLGSKQRYGCLLLRNQEQEVILTFHGDLVGLVTPPDEKMGYIPEKLFHAGKISPEDYESMMQSNNPLKTMEQVVDPQDFLDIASTIYYEEICQLFTWEEGEFEFTEQQDLEGELEALGKLFESESILMESAQRIDETPELYRVLPEDHEEILVHAAEYPSPEPPDPGEHLGNVWNLIAHHTIREVVSFSFLSSFDAAKILASLYEDGTIRTLTDEELKGYAQELQEQGEGEVAVKYCKLALKRNPYDEETADDLIKYFEVTEDEESMANFFRDMAQRLLPLEDPEQQARGAFFLKNFCEISQESPEGIEARFLLLEMICEGKVDPKKIDFDPIADGRHLFQLLRRKKNDAQARHVLEQLLAITPHDKSLQGEYINILQELGEREKAVEQLESMAKVHDLDNNLVDLEATYKRIVKLMPSRSDIANKLEKVKRRRQGKKGLLAKLAIFLVVVGIGVGAFWLNQEKQKKVKAAAKKTKAEIDKAIKENNLKRAIELKEKLSGSGDIGDIETLIKKKQEQNNAKADKLHTQARAEKNIYQAIKKLQEALKCRPEGKIKKDINDDLSFYKGHIKNFKSDLKKAKANEKISLLAARKSYQKIWNNKDYEKIPERKEIRYPLFLTVAPVGATAIFDNKKTIKLKSKTTIIHCSPEFKELRVKLSGYTDHVFFNAFEIKDPQARKKRGKIIHPLHKDTRIELKKELLWEFSSIDAKIDTIPAYANDKLFIAARDDKVYAVSGLFSGPEVVWKTQSLSLASFKSSPCIYKGVLYVGGNNNFFYAIAIRNGKVLDKYRVPREIESSPAILLDKAVVFGTSGGKVYALKLISKNNRRLTRYWSRPFSARSKIDSTIVTKGSYVFFRSNKGYLYALKGKSNGALAWKSKIGSTARCSPGVYVDRRKQLARVYAGSGKMLAFDIATRKKTNKHVLKSERVDRIIQGRIVADDQGAYFCTTSWKAYQYTHKGELKLIQDFDGAIQGGPVLNKKGILYVATKNGVLYALDVATKSIFWKYKVGDRIENPPFLLKNPNKNLVIVTTKKSIFAFVDN